MEVQCSATDSRHYSATFATSSATGFSGRSFCCAGAKAKAGGVGKGQSQAKVRAGVQQTCIGPNNQAGIVWHVTSQAIGCGLEVALVTSQIHQGDHLGGPSNVLGRRVATKHLIIQDVALAVQLQGTKISGLEDDNSS